MKTLVHLIIASTLLVSACVSPSSDNAKAHASVTTLSASSVHNYRCESGETIAATYPSSDLATVQYQGNNYSMRIAISASGARYVGGGLEWWTKGSGPGSDGTLFRHMADGMTGEIIERCSES